MKLQASRGFSILNSGLGQHANERIGLTALPGSGPAGGACATVERVAATLGLSMFSSLKELRA